MSTPRPVRGFTIDASTSTDLDDALWVRPLPDAAGWRVWVTIAAAGAAVLPGSLEDQEARARVETRYRDIGHKPMLSRPTEKQVSLAPYRKRDGLTVELDVTMDGDVTQVELYPSHIESAARLSHADIPAILADAAGRCPVAAEVKEAAALATTLLGRRRRAGALALYDLRHGWATDEDGIARRIEPDRATIGYIVVQELMILANAEMAKFARTNGIPILYRTHAVRGTGPDRAALLAALDAAQVADVPDIGAITARVEHLLDRARYRADPAPHWGLALDLYAHLTSPIRRYADLVSQRQLLAFLADQPLPYDRVELAAIAEHINRTIAEREERAAARQAETATSEGERSLALPSATLTRLDDTRFERVLKVATRSGQDCPEALAAAIRVRLAEGKLANLCKLVVLLQSPPIGERWGALRRDVLGVIQHLNPGDATSILQIAVSLGLLPEVTRETCQPGGPQGPFVASSRAKLDSGERYASATDRKKKTAMALADVALLAALRDIRFEAPSADGAPKAPPAPKALPKVDPLKPPVSMLLELCQAAGAEPPAFVVSEPTPQRFTCEARCVFPLPGGEVAKGMGRGDGHSKATAKSAAAQRALDWLVELGIVERLSPETAAPTP